MKNGDLISREALTSELLKGTIITDDIYGMGIMVGMDAAIKKVNEAPAVDAVEVVLCKNCILHGSCLTEDTFKIARIENPYCCGGKRRMDGE